MSQIIQFMAALMDSLDAIINFVVDYFQDALYFAILTVEMIPALPAFFTWIPGALWNIFFMLFGLVVVLRVLGRNE